MTLPMRLHIYSNNDPVFYKSQVAPKISSMQKSKPLAKEELLRVPWQEKDQNTIAFSLESL